MRGAAAAARARVEDFFFSSGRRCTCGKIESGGFKKDVYIYLLVRNDGDFFFSEGWKNDTHTHVHPSHVCCKNSSFFFFISLCLSESESL